MRFKSSLLAATAAALAAVGGTAVAGYDGRGGGDRGNDHSFATIKDGTKLVVFGDRHSNARAIRGLNPGETVVGIDVRPTDGDGAANGQDDGKLYGLGKQGSVGRVFEIDPRSGQVKNAQALNVALNGDFFGVDFNPTVDRLRIISDSEQNLRANVDTGVTLTDANLAYPAGDRRAAINPSAVGAGYTYAPFGGQTTLYDVDTANPDFFVLQNPPNAGTLNSIGPIGVDAGGQLGFDVAGKNRFVGYELAQQGDRAKLYRLKFNRNGKALDTGLSLRGTSYDGLAVLDGYGGGSY